MCEVGFWLRVRVKARNLKKLGWLQLTFHCPEECQTVVTYCIMWINGRTCSNDATSCVCSSGSSWHDFRSDCNMTCWTSTIIRGRNSSKQTLHDSEKITEGHVEVIAWTSGTFRKKISAKACAVNILRKEDDVLLRNNTKFKQCFKSLEFTMQLTILVVH